MQSCCPSLVLILVNRVRRSIYRDATWKRTRTVQSCYISLRDCLTDNEVMHHDSDSNHCKHDVNATIQTIFLKTRRIDEFESIAAKPLINQDPFV
jgi:hypothetical protein